ncbi:hypothetical protein K3495_g5450 [Podosphaera aphanis]|nr:hypothetical protein K3495_g5450 [Podosphaera aphanis]
MAKIVKESVVENSDEDGDSESSLEDIEVLLAHKTSEIRARQGLPVSDQSSSISSNTGYKKRTTRKPSLTIKPKYKYDLKTLAKDARNEDATEASARKAEELLDPSKRAEYLSPTFGENTPRTPGSSQTPLFDMYVAGAGNGAPAGYMVKRAIENVESNLKDEHWYFFDSDTISVTARKPFPIASIPGDWRNEMADLQLRDSAFISGFIEDMVMLGRPLPDELFCWLLDEISYQEDQLLRFSYLNVLVQSPEDQIHRLIDPKIMLRLFHNLKAHPRGTMLSQKIEIINAIPGYYANRDWSKLLSVLNFIERIAGVLHTETRKQAACILLRMSLDSIIIETVDILDSFQKAINSLCKYTLDEGWDDFCQEICKSLLCCVDQPTLFLQMVESMPSISQCSHDLRRRLALCFLFKDLSFANTHPDNMVTLEIFIARLGEGDFERKCQTDYYELRALVMLLNVAVDNGRSHNLDLLSETAEANFNDNVDQLGSSIRRILGALGAPGDVSKIQAKEAIETISQKIIYTMRTKPKLVHGWSMKQDRRTNNTEAERRCMESFVTKMKNVATGRS